MNNSRFLFSSLWIALAALANAQNQPDISTLLNAQNEPDTFQFDTSRMKVSVKMDRTTYLPGEAAQITLAVENPGAKVTSLTPFSARTGCTYLSWKDGEEFRYPREISCDGFPVTSQDLTVFQTGERKELVLNSYDISELGRGTLWGDSAVPYWHRTSRLAYRYGSSTATADFDVVAAKLEAHAVARVRDEMYTPNPLLKPPEALPQYVYALALRAEEQTYICVSLSNVTSANETFRDLKGGFEPGGAAPFRRVATSAAPVVRLSVSADSNDNLTLEWTDATGGTRTFWHQASYPMRERAERRRRR